tara:strand:+ start:368 stop:1189 length:822 start_codon:yes stop_codon:yes gene_type:complete
MINLCILDFETTGLLSTSDEIIECALKIYGKNNIYDKLVKPIKKGKSNPGYHGAYILPKITELTGITNKIIHTNGITQSELAENIFNFLENNHVEYIAAHNGDSFDFIFLKLLFIKYNYDYTKYKFIDTIYLFKNIHKQQSISNNSYSQKNLCTKYNIVQNNAHRAIGDVLDLESLIYEILTEYSLYIRKYINYNDKLIYEYSKKYNYSDYIISHIKNIVKYLQSNDNTYIIENVNKKTRLLIYSWLEKNVNYKIYHKTENDKVMFIKNNKLL